MLFLSDYFAGRALYGALATYHAYLEFPVLLALLMSPRTVRPGSRRMISLGLLGRPVPSGLLPS